LQKLSQNKATGANTKHIASPLSRKSQIKTEINWNNQTNSILNNQERHLQVSNIFSNKVGSHDAKGSLERERNENYNISNFGVQSGGLEQQGAPDVRNIL
jgi:hypothetical protein